ncbi:MAG: hypothetical protein IT320_27040 [Anaerolineae bacterium]|nr:hypothetical protein [Anaerolineae bacterium]
MANADRVARQESILLPILIVALGGAIAGGSYGLALLPDLNFDTFLLDTMDLWAYILPLVGGMTMGLAVSLSLSRSGLRLRRNHILDLVVIWAIGSGTILPILHLMSGSANTLGGQLIPFVPVIAGGFTGWATRETIERVVGFRLTGVSLSAAWGAGFIMFVLSYALFFAFIYVVFFQFQPDSALWFLLTGMVTGGLIAGCSAWLMIRDVESALRRRSHVKPRNTLDAGDHGALEVVRAPEAEIQGKPKVKRGIDIPVPETPRQWRMVTLAGLLVFVQVAAFFLIFPVRTVTVFVTPLPNPTVVPYPTPPMVSLQGTQMIFPPPTQPLPDVDPPPLYFIGQKVLVANLSPDIANYVDWWVSRYQWLPEEREWIYEVVTFNNITIMRAEDQLAPLPMPPALPMPSPTPTIPIRLT